MDRRTFIVGSVAFLTACSTNRGSVTIGSKNFTEQLLLGEILAQTIERSSSLMVDRRFYLAGTYICQQAILAGRISAYVEYTGTALTAVLKHAPFTDPHEVFDLVRREYRQRFALAVLPSLGFDNSFVVVMRAADATRHGTRSLSDLAKIAPSFRLGVGYEFLERPDGYNGLAQKYGLKFAEPPRVMDLGLLYRALQNRQVDVVVGSNTDGLIAALNLVVLVDDLHYFPPYDAVPILRLQTIDNAPLVGTALLRLAGKISPDRMRAMNYSVDGQKKDASLVARQFLEQSGI